MGKFFALLVLVLSLGIALAQLQPLKPTVPSTPLLTSNIREVDIVGPYGSVWKVYWDGWEGTLVFFKNGTGYVEVEGKRYSLSYAILKNPQNDVAGMKGPGYTGKDSNLGHRVVFLVDFAQTPNTEDDQRFEGYVFTQTIRTPSKRAMAGITWWNGIPFGFYAVYWYDVPG